ncbi:MAG: VWA containing CoxE-like protein, partial [Acidobacteriota bacterium]
MTRPRLDLSDQPALLRNLVQFARGLRRLGVETTPEQMTTAATAIERVGLRDRERFRAATRAALVSRREHLEPFDRLFELFWRRDAERPRLDIDLG